METQQVLLVGNYSWFCASIKVAPREESCRPSPKYREVVVSACGPGLLGFRLRLPMDVSCRGHLPLTVNPCFDESFDLKEDIPRYSC